MRCCHLLDKHAKTRSYKFKFITGSNQKVNLINRDKQYTANNNCSLNFRQYRTNKIRGNWHNIYITLDCTGVVINTYWLNSSNCCTYNQLPQKCRASGFPGVKRCAPTADSLNRRALLTLSVFTGPVSGRPSLPRQRAETLPAPSLRLSSW